MLPGHQYTKAVTPPTCTEGGYTTYTCTVCGDTYTDDRTEPLGHDFHDTVIAPSCGRDGYTEYRCTLCGYSYRDQYTPALDHTWTQWTTEQEATCTQPGDANPNLYLLRPAGSRCHPGKRTQLHRICNRSFL